MSTAIPEPVTIEYPVSDGMPMADNTLQFQYIVTIQGGLDALFKDDPNVFVAGDHLWYPVEGHPEIRSAPDVYVVFGRPKGHRGSYKQWEEGGIAPHVVFEVLSPSNRFPEMQRKFRFYERHGVEEYYVYDPVDGALFGWQRTDDVLRAVPEMQRCVSPRLKIQFELSDGELHLYGPDGRPFLTYVELKADRDQERQARLAAEHRAELLAAKLRELGIEPPA